MRFPQNDHDPYQLLGVHLSASFDEVQAAYRRRAMACHPDRNARADAAETFSLIRSAYELLRNPSSRADYDRHVAARRGRGEGSRGRAAATQPPAQPTARGAADLKRRVCISLDQQLHGGRVDLPVSRTEYCTACAGAGIDGASVACSTCEGIGRLRSPLGWFQPFFSRTTTCGDCGGAGVVRPPCAACRGDGIIARKRGRLGFEVPAGVPPGGTLRVRGHGRRGRGGKASGDLIVHIAIAPHPLFEPAFPDLHCEMPISVFRALAGGTLEVPTLGNPASVPLPTELATGTVIRLDGQGMLNGATGKRGDLLLRLVLIRPKLSEVQRELLTRLERLSIDDPRSLDWARRLRQADRGSSSDRRAA